MADQHIAIIGGGINGIMTAWELLKQGHRVTLFEKGEVMKQTSSASSKLLHGGLRYLENYEFRLVKEALKERQWWIAQVPHLAHPIKLYIPIYKTSHRPAWLYKLGLCVYDYLAGKQNIGKHKSLTRQQIQQACPDLKTEGLIKGFSFFDGQMDDYQLGLWALEQAEQMSHGYTLTDTDKKEACHCEERSDVAIFNRFTLCENTEVIQVDGQGNLTQADGNTQTYDKIINIAGPWAEQLLTQNDIKAKYTLDLVRGSHILVETASHRHTQTNTDKGEARHCEERSDVATPQAEVNQGYFLEIPNERRIFFVLPYKGKTLIGTTEERQTLNDSIYPSQQEVDYLINAYNYYFKTAISKENIVDSFAGLRPLIKSADNPNKATREYAIQKNQNLITVFGGKWTTARQLAQKVLRMAV